MYEDELLYGVGAHIQPLRVGQFNPRKFDEEEDSVKRSFSQYNGTVRSKPSHGHYSRVEDPEFIPSEVAIHRIGSGSQDSIDRFFEQLNIPPSDAIRELGISGFTTNSRKFSEVLEHNAYAKPWDLVAFVPKI